MEYLISLLLTLIIIIGFVSLMLLGKRLELFSSDHLEKSKILKYALIRWLMFATIGFVYLLSKIHFPGIETIVTYSFDNNVGNVLRAAYWKARIHSFGKNIKVEVGAKAIYGRNITIGDNSWIDRNVLLIAGKEISKDKYLVYVKENKSFKGKKGELRIGRGCHIAPNVVIQAIGGVEIGDYTGIASGAKIYSLSHHYRNIMQSDEVIYKFTPCAPPEEQSLIEGPVVFEGNNALGLNSVVLPGVTIGKNSWVGVCSYVVDDIPPNSIAIGCPAKVIKKRFIN
ncbi:hypothetical protein KEJ43_06685 [Candidatus Bathyarchaeota archaeon]|nr:hypothetical protein [Candidatus Bathyarchaeota archaeon]